MPVNYTGYRDGNAGLIQSLRVGHQGQTTILNVAATATQFTASGPIVRIVATVSASIKCAEAAGTAAATTDMLLPASVVEYIVIDHGKTVSCISATGGIGSLYVTEAL